MDEKQLQKLIKKNAAKAAKLAKARDGRKFDKTLPPPAVCPEICVKISCGPEKRASLAT